MPSAEFLRFLRLLLSHLDVILTGLMNNMIMNHRQTCSVLCCSEVPWSCKTTVAVLTPSILEPITLTLNAEQRKHITAYVQC
jgi:hypothetical protein